MKPTRQLAHEFYALAHGIKTAEVSESFDGAELDLIERLIERTFRKGLPRDHRGSVDDNLLERLRLAGPDPLLDDAIAEIERQRDKVLEIGEHFHMINSRYRALLRSKSTPNRMTKILAERYPGPFRPRSTLAE